MKTIVELDPTEHSPIQRQDRTTYVNKWMIGVLGSIAGFLTSQMITYYTFSKTLETTKRIEMIHLARELTHDFYKEEDKTAIFRSIREAIESCQRLYDGYKKGGKFTHDQINRYLGFFDDLGFYYKEGILDYRIVDQLFGAYIIEAYEYNELRQYVADGFYPIFTDG